MRILSSQLAELKSTQPTEFRNRLVRYLETHRKTDQQNMFWLADQAIEDCARIGLSREIDVANYAYRCVVICPNWTTTAHLTRFASILADQSIPPGNRFTKMQQAEVAANVNPFDADPSDTFDFDKI